MNALARHHIKCTRGYRGSRNRDWARAVKGGENISPGESRRSRRAREVVLGTRARGSRWRCMEILGAAHEKLFVEAATAH